MENKLGYLKIPLPLIRLLLVRPGEAENVIRFAVYNMAQEYAADPTNVFRQILWAFYQSNDFDDDEIGPRNDRILEDKINETLIDLWESRELSVDFERRGFTQSGEFLGDYDCQIEELEEYAKTDTNFYEDCELWHKLRQLCSNVGIPFEGVACYENACARFANRVTDNSVFAMIKSDIMTRYAKLSQSKIVPEYERVQFVCNAAIKSIIGTKEYGTASKKLILARMMGKRSSTDETPDILSRKEKTEANKIFEKYSARRQFEKLLNKMIQYGYLKSCIGYGKSGYIISTKLDENEVIEIVKQRAIEKRMAKTRVQNASEKLRKTLKDLE